MAKVILSLFNLIFVSILGILVMVYGWGLEPQSWGWIIGGYVGLVVSTSLTTLAAEE